jgi:formamidopyrimidine-DNA glycosylase
MWWVFDAGPSLLVHFGMTGGMVVQGVGAAHYKSFALDDSSWPPRFVKFELRFDDGTRLAFCDARRFAKVRQALGWACACGRQALAG